MNEYIPGIKEKVYIFGNEIYVRGENAFSWSQQHGLNFLESAGKSTVELVYSGVGYVKSGSGAIGQCCVDIYE